MGERTCDRCGCIDDDVRVREDVRLTGGRETVVVRPAKLCDFCHARVAGTEPDPLEAVLASGEAW